jgi:hypothetical protein
MTSTIQQERFDKVHQITGDLSRKVDELPLVLAAVSFDITFASQHINEKAAEDDSEDQFWRRTLVRALFAAVEAVSYSLKRFALAASEVPGVNFSAADLAALREEAYDLEESGKPKTSKAKLRTLPNLLYAFQAFTRAQFIEYNLDTKGQDWEAMRATIKIRDRLTHPKGSGSLIVTNKDLDLVIQAAHWFPAAFSDMITKCSIAEDTKRLLAWVHEK